MAANYFRTAVTKLIKASHTLPAEPSVIWDREGQKRPRPLKHSQVTQSFLKSRICEGGGWAHIIYTPDLPGNKECPRELKGVIDL